MAAITRTALPSSPRPRRFARRFRVAVFVALALAAWSGSPASALSITGVTLPGGGILVAPPVPPVPPDPCLPQPHVLSFTAAPATIDSGTSTTLSWNVQGPGGCNYLVVLGGQSVGSQGSLQVQPLFNTSYTLTLLWGPTRALRTIATTTVSVNLPADPHDPARQLVTIPAQEMVPLFLQALNTPNTTVVINADLDLSGLDSIPIAEGVRMVGGRAAVPGQPYLAGPRLHTTSFTDPLFSIVRADNVRITGVRLEGPHMQANNRGIASSSSLNLEVDHNEIYGWSGAAVELADWDARIVVPSSSGASGITYAQPSEPVWIHDNYIHDNYVGDPYFGYGVSLGRGAHALIERNVFDGHYHAISGDGTPLTGYRAYRNLVLPNGAPNNQQFDMHGDGQNCHAECGTAGHDVDIRWNSFVFTDGPAIMVRGTPGLQPYGAVIKSNVFAHSYLTNPLFLSDGAVVDTVGYGPEAGLFPMSACQGNGPSSSCGPDDNKLGVTTWYAVNHCDFDGDGINDDFLATGQTLWYRSGDTSKTPTPWVYLNTSPRHLNELSLGYFSGQHVCDVVDGGLISVGGTGPWKLMLFFRAQ